MSSSVHNNYAIKTLNTLIKIHAFTNNEKPNSLNSYCINKICNSCIYNLHTHNEAFSDDFQLNIYLCLEITSN